MLATLRFLDLITMGGSNRFLEDLSPYITRDWFSEAVFDTKVVKDDYVGHFRVFLNSQYHLGQVQGQRKPGVNREQGQCKALITGQSFFFTKVVDSEKLGWFKVFPELQDHLGQVEGQVQGTVVKRKAILMKKWIFKNMYSPWRNIFSKVWCACVELRSKREKKNQKKVLWRFSTSSAVQV